MKREAKENNFREVAVHFSTLLFSIHLISLFNYFPTFLHSRCVRAQSFRKESSGNVPSVINVILGS